MSEDDENAMKAKIDRDQKRTENNSNRIETKIERDQEQAENDSKTIETLEKEKDDFKNKWMRSMADHQNQEKQLNQKVSQEILKNKLNLLSEFMTIYEDFIRAENSLSKNNVDTSGIEVIRKNMEKILSENNITPIDATIGKPFDRKIHEAVSVAEDNSVDEDTIIQEVAKGYYAEEGILKPSKVIVSKKKSEK
jgi:molecular chaperone GrpE